MNNRPTRVSVVENREKRDATHLILSALIQRGVSTPRCELTDEEILKALSKYRPDKQIWPRRKS
jgi:uncharacterized protein YqeY